MSRPVFPFVILFAVLRSTSNDKGTSCVKITGSQLSALLLFKMMFYYSDMVVLLLLGTINVKKTSLVSEPVMMLVIALLHNFACIIASRPLF